MTSFAALGPFAKLLATGPSQDESKFEATVNTQMGNTVIENAEISIIQVDPDLPVERFERRNAES